MNTPYWAAGDEYEGIFQKFRLGLQNWCRTGKEPKAGDQDIKYYLDLQEKRLKEHGLTLELDMQPQDKVMSLHKIISFMPLPGNASSQFNKSLYAQYVTRKAVFSREGKTLLRQKKDVTMYQTILNPAAGDKNLGKTTYICPNCGSISTLEVLQETGCPYCGTRFLMKELYPKVTNYYCLETASMSEKKSKTYHIALCTAAACLSLIQVLVSLYTDPDMELYMALLGWPLGFGICLLALHIFASLALLGYSLVKAGKSVPMLMATAGSKAALTERLKTYDPSFDYTYFEGKALSLARILMFSDHPEEYAQYRGPALGNRFADVVDVQYRGSIAVRRIERVQDRIEVELNLFLTNTLDRGGKIRQKDEKIRLSMYHQAAFPVNPVFSIVKVQCPYCSGSFDAARQKDCPFCGQPYDAGIADWVVTDLRR